MTEESVRLRRTGSLKVSLKIPLESLFDKEGIRELGARGLKTSCQPVPLSVI
jgi:hypothetical protein